MKKILSIDLDDSLRRNDPTRNGDRFDEKRQKLSPQKGKEEVDEEFDVDNITVSAAVWMIESQGHVCVSMDGRLNTTL